MADPLIGKIELTPYQTPFNTAQAQGFNVQGAIVNSIQQQCLSGKHLPMTDPPQLRTPMDGDNLYFVDTESRHYQLSVCRHCKCLFLNSE